MQKKNWVKPELIVLIRGRPEENVLTGCKFAASGPHSAWGGCLIIIICYNECDMISMS